MATITHGRRRRVALAIRDVQAVSSSTTDGREEAARRGVLISVTADTYLRTVHTLMGNGMEEAGGGNDGESS